ncbi:MAG: hypothetical protein K6F37_05915 [Lachnospiraceae bacterium]|nr:hypothetical protein [Lachnospiraceae bacterium]
MTEYSLGYVAGFLATFIVVIIITAWARKNKQKCEYDERQQLIRGKAYKYAFFGTFISAFCFMALIGSEIYPVSAVHALFLTMMVGLVIYVVYSVWHDAYFTVNSNPSRYLILIAVIGIMNLFSGIVEVRANGFDITENSNGGSINLYLGVVFSILFVVLLLKKFVKKEDAE